ncbi:MAG: hypothetical protein ACOC8D_01560 [bacterium]
MRPRRLWRALLSHPRLWLLPLAWALIVLVALIALRATVPEERHGLPAVAGALAGTALVALLGLALLGLRFYRGIRAVRDELYRGEYEQALESAREHASVAVGLGFESAIERLLEFDRRRAAKVASATRLLNRLLRETPTPILIGDLVHGQVRFSRALRDRFGVSDDRFAIDALLRPEGNAEFARLWRRLVRGEESSIQASLTLHLPVRQAAQRLDLQLFAIQDDEGRIAYILGFAEPPPPPRERAKPEPQEVTATE